MDINVKEQLSDHEIRLRDLEKNSTEMRYELVTIKNELKDVKLMMVEYNNKQTELLTKFINNTLNIKITNNKNAWDLIFKIIVGFSVITNAIIAFYSN